MKIIDLSVTVKNSPSEPMKMKIERTSHEKGAKHFCRQVAWNNHLPFKMRLKQLWHYLKGNNRLEARDFPDGLFLTLDQVSLPSHMGTHIDAPIHYGPLCEGKPAKSVEELPLEWFFAKGVRLDLRHKKAGEYIQVKDIQDSLMKIKCDLQPNTIVLVWTGTDKKWGTREYFSQAPGMSEEAVDWLTSHGVKVIGIDTYGIDRPFSVMLQDFWKTKNNKHLWPAHFFGRTKEYIHLERLMNLEQLPDKDFFLSCLPLKIEGLDASWVRAIGIVLEEGEKI